MPDSPSKDPTELSQEGADYRHFSKSFVNAFNGAEKTIQEHDQVELQLAVAIARNNQRTFYSLRTEILDYFGDHERFRYLEKLSLEQLHEGGNETRRIMSRCLTTAIYFLDRKTTKKLLQYANDA